MSQRAVATVLCVLVIAAGAYLAGPPTVPEPTPGLISRQIACGDREVEAGDYAKALDTFAKAFEQARVDDDSHAMGKALARVGNMNRIIGDDVKTAEEQLETALRIVRTHRQHSDASGDDYAVEAFILQKLGALQAQVGRNDLALQRVGEAANVYERARPGSFVTERVEALEWQANLNIELLNVDAAAHLVAKADDLCKRECAAAADILQTRGDIALKHGELDKADALYRQAIATYGPKDRQGIANVLFTLAEVDRRRGRFDEARRDLDEGEKQSPEKYSAANILFGRAELAVATRHFAAAHQWFAAAYTAYGALDGRASQAEVAVTEGNLFLAEGERDKARDSFDKAVTIFRSVQSPRRLAEAATLAAAARKPVSRKSPRR